MDIDIEVESILKEVYLIHLEVLSLISGVLLNYGATAVHTP